MLENDNLYGKVERSKVCEMCLQFLKGWKRSFYWCDGILNNSQVSLEFSSINFGAVFQTRSISESLNVWPGHTLLHTLIILKTFHS